MGRGDAGFQGIDPQQLARLMTSLSGGVSRAQPLASSYVGRFTRLGLDTGAVHRLLADYGWAAAQQPMLSRRHSLASHQPPSDFTDGMATAGAGALAFATPAAAAKAGTAAARQLARALAAGDDDGAMQQLAALAEQGDDTDYTKAFWGWVSKNDPALMAIAQPAFAAYSETMTHGLPAWYKATSALWRSPQILHDHAFGGPTRPNGPPHAPDFNAASEGEYAKFAYQFLAKAKDSGFDLKLQGSTLRVYDQATNSFASFSVNGTVKTFFKPNAASYWASQNGTLPAGNELDTTLGNATSRVDEAAPWFGRVARVMDSPAGRAAGKGLQVLGAAADVYTIAAPSPDALGGANTERAMAAANLGAMAVTAGPAAAVLAANSLDWVPVAGEVVLVGTAAYFVGDLVYENRQAIGHALSWAGHETGDVAKDVGHDISSGVSSAWHSVFG